MPPSSCRFVIFLFAAAAIYFTMLPRFLFAIFDSAAMLADYAFAAFHYAFDIAFFDAARRFTPISPFRLRFLMPRVYVYAAALFTRCALLMAPRCRRVAADAIFSPLIALLRRLITLTFAADIADDDTAIYAMMPLIFISPIWPAAFAARDFLMLYAFAAAASPMR